MFRFWPRLLRAGAPMLLAMMAQLAHAQYSWLDEKGTRVFSDRPPPPGTPSSRILKAPRMTGSPGASPSSPAPAEAAAEAPKTPTLAERDADYRKRAAQREDTERKSALEAERKARLAESCESTRQYEAQLMSGERVARANRNGEREFLSDEERARLLDRTRRALAECR